MQREQAHLSVTLLYADKDKRAGKKADKIWQKHKRKLDSFNFVSGDLLHFISWRVNHTNTSLMPWLWTDYMNLNLNLKNNTQELPNRADTGKLQGSYLNITSEGHLYM